MENKNGPRKSFDDNVFIPWGLHPVKSWVVSELQERGQDYGLKNKDWEYTYSEAYANRAFGFISALRHTKGEFAGQRFNIQPFQEFFIILTAILKSLVRLSFNPHSAAIKLSIFILSLNFVLPS